MKVDVERVLNYSIVGLGLLPILPNSLTGILPVILFFCALAIYLKNPIRSSGSRTLVVNSLLFFVYAASLLYTQDLSYGWRKLGPAVWILVFSISFYLFLDQYSIGKKTWNSMLRVMTGSTAIYLVVFLLFVFYSGQWMHSPETSLANHLRSLMSKLPVLDRHPIYLSLFIGVSSLYSTHLLISKEAKNAFEKSLLISLLLVFILFLLLIQGKGALLYLVLSFPVLVIFSPGKKIWLALLVFAIAFVSGVVLLSRSDSQNRFRELFDAKTYSEDKINPYNSSQIRVVIWKTCIEAISRAPVLGYGLGDAQHELNNLYEDKSPVLLKETYNSHNQYLGVWLVSGLVGLLLFLYFLFYNCILLIKGMAKREPLSRLGFAILLFYMLNFLTENVIDRQLGSLSFFFLVNLIGSVVQKENKEIILDPPDPQKI